MEPTVQWIVINLNLTLDFTFGQEPVYAVLAKRTQPARREPQHQQLRGPSWDLVGWFVKGGGGAKLPGSVAAPQPATDCIVAVKVSTVGASPHLHCISSSISTAVCQYSPPHAVMAAWMALRLGRRPSSPMRSRSASARRDSRHDAIAAIAAE